jgi:predicted CoA-binding protein
MKTMQQILQDSKTIAVVGLSARPERASHQVADYLQAHGYRILPVNPLLAGGEILGEKVYADLHEAAAALAPGQRIDLVDCFRKAEDIGPLARDAVAIGAGCLWMQLGIVNVEAAEFARAAGLEVVMDACTKIEHRPVAPA